MGGNIIKKRYFISFISSFFLVILVFKIYVANNIEKIEISNDVKDKIQNNIFSYPDINHLKKEYNNNDIIGYILIPNIVETPFVKYSDNNYYKRKNLYKNDDLIGSPFIDYRNIITDKKIVIYGCNLSKYNESLSNLEKYYNEDYYYSNQYIYIKINNQVIKYQIFSVYIELSDWDYTKIKFKDNNEYYNHVSILKDKSWYDTLVKIHSSDRIIVLQTCSNLDEYKNKPLIISAKKIQ